MTIQKDLHSLQDIRTSRKLLNRISSMTDNLSSHSHGFNIPLVLFKTGIIAIILFLVIGISTGTLIAAKVSSQGDLLFPIKQALQKHNALFFAPQITPIASPAPTNINNVIPSHVNSSVQENNKNSSENASSSGKEEKNNNRMSGKSENPEKSKQEDTFFPPDFSHFHFNFFKHKD